MAAGVGTGWDIRSVALDGATPLEATPREATDLVATPGNDLYPAVSPDGRWLAYMSDETGRYEVYVRPYPEGTGRWQVSVQGGGFPRWTRDGRELVFRDGDLRGDTWSAVEVTADGDSIRTGKPRAAVTGPYAALFPFASFDVAPDEERWIFLRPAESSSPAGRGERRPAVHLVLGWFDDLAGAGRWPPSGTKNPRAVEGYGAGGGEGA